MKKNGLAIEAVGSGDADGYFTGNQKNIIEFQTDPLDWWRGLVDLFAGPNHELKIGVRISGDVELVEIIGTLPKPLRKGLRRYAPWNDNDYMIEWVVRPDGYGSRYELHDMSDLFDHFMQRKVFFLGGK